MKATTAKEAELLMKKWLSGLVLALAALICAGAASAEEKLTITYDRARAQAGETVTANYLIEGVDYTQIHFRWVLSSYDNSDVRTENCWKSGDIAPTGQSGSVSVAPFGGGWVYLDVYGFEGDVDYAPDILVSVTGDACLPLQGKVVPDRRTAAPGETIAVDYSAWGFTGARHTIELTCDLFSADDDYVASDWILFEKLDSDSGSFSVTLPADLPANAAMVEFVLYVNDYLDNGMTVTAYPTADWKVALTEGGGSAVLNGLVLDADGVFRLYAGGQPDMSYFGIYDYNGGRFFIANGTIVPLSGLVSDGVDWYYLANGQVADYTGLALYDGEWFYVTNGVLDTMKAGLVSYDGREFMVAAGRILTEARGMIQEPNTGEWYYVADGQVADYSGLVEYNGAWFWVTGGRLDATVNGTFEYDGAAVTVVNGQVV